MPSIWRRTVEWLTNATRIRPPPTCRGGAGPGGASVNSLHGPRSRSVIQRRKSPTPWSSGDPGDEKRFPSKRAAEGTPASALGGRSRSALARADDREALLAVKAPQQGVVGARGLELPDVRVQKRCQVRALAQGEGEVLLAGERPGQLQV